MASPEHEKAQSSYPAVPADQRDNPLQEEQQHHRSSDEDATLQGEAHDHGDVGDHGDHRDQGDHRDHRDQGDQGDLGYLRVASHDYAHDAPLPPPLSAQHRERASRLDDDLTMLQAERLASKVDTHREREGSRDSRTLTRTRSRADQEPVDDFDIPTNPMHLIKKIYQPPARPATRLAKFVKRVHESSNMVRYFVYITPLTMILLVPTLLGLFIFKKCTVGDVELFWFGVWLEIAWLTMWLSRVSLPSQYRQIVLTYIIR